MPATTLIFNPKLEQGEPSRASRIAAGVKRKVRGSLQESDTRETEFPREMSGELGSSPVGTTVEHFPNAGPRAEWSDVELVQAFQSGDEKAFAELYTRRKREIYTFCVRMLGGDRDLANDAFQETFIKVYEKGHSFRTGANVMGWLFMIARNTCLNLHRSKRPVETLDEQRNLVSNDRSLAPEFGEEQHYLRDLLEQAIGILPEEFREPFILREYDGFSYGEIAKMTGVSLPTTKVRIYRAKQRLRELLQPYLMTDEKASADGGADHHEAEDGGGDAQGELDGQLGKAKEFLALLDNREYNSNSLGASPLGANLIA